MQSYASQVHKISRKDCGYRKFQTKVYNYKDCYSCKKRSLCTRQKYRTINLEEKRREIIKEWIDSGRIEEINSNASSDKESIFYPEGKEYLGRF